MPGRPRRPEVSQRGASSQPVASTSRDSQVFASQSVRRPSQATSSFTDEDVDESVSAAVMMALSLVGSGKPFKKSDLLQGSRIKSRTTGDVVVKKVQDELFDVYGLKLVEVPQGKFIVVLPKTTAFRNELAAKSEAVSPAFSSLLGVVLTLIFVQKGRVADDYLRTTMLPKLFPDILTSPHPFFGNVDKLFQEFEQQLYITKESEARRGETKVFYSWGVRAEHEINKKALVVPIIKAMFGGNVPSSLMAELDEGDPVSIDEDED